MSSGNASGVPTVVCKSADNNNRFVHRTDFSTCETVVRTMKNRKYHMQDARTLLILHVSFVLNMMPFSLFQRSDDPFTNGNVSGRTAVIVVQLAA